jgi:hypothetical protein
MVALLQQLHILTLGMILCLMNMIQFICLLLMWSSKRTPNNVLYSMQCMALWWFKSLHCTTNLEQNTTQPVKLLYACLHINFRKMMIYGLVNKCIKDIINLRFSNKVILFKMYISLQITTILSNTLFAIFYKQNWYFKFIIYYY